MVGDNIEFTLPTRDSTPKDVPLEDDPVPALFADRYRIGELAGSGGFGVVYAATDERLQKTVAVKVMRGGRSRSARAIERFRTEALTTGQLNHPNIAAVTDFGRLDDGRPYLVMEFVEGESLSDVLRREGVLPVQRAARIGHALCAGLVAAHAQGVIHRDLKPANVIIHDDEHVGSSIKIVDFGIAKLTQSVVSTESTETSGLIGTPMYMAPEQIRQREDLDGRADVYALGVILFRMLTGKTPFSGRPAGDLMIAKATEKPPRLRLLNDAIPPALEKIVMRAMQPEPDKRTPSAERLAEELAPFVHGQVVVRAAPRWLVPAAVVLVVGAGALVYSLTRGDARRNSSAPVHVPQAVDDGAAAAGIAPRLHGPAAARTATTTELPPDAGRVPAPAESARAKPVRAKPSRAKPIRTRPVRRKGAKPKKADQDLLFGE